MKRWLILISLLLLPVVGLAQPTPQVKWEHDGLNLSYFNCVVYGPAPAGTTTNIGKPTPVNTTYSVDITACTGVMVNGTHSVVIAACNASDQCTPATAITVVKL